MARQKKSRKVGQIGTPKTSSNIKKPTEKRVKKPLGKPAGSRNNISTTSNKSTAKKVAKDPRHGSKKPVDLLIEQPAKKTTQKVKHFSPSEELAAIEQDSHLSGLLNKLDIGKALDKKQQQYVDKNLARHKELCEMLGLTGEKEEDTAQESDPFDTFESIDINDFK